MPKIINISFYGATGEKNLNEHVAMRSEETCPDCEGKGVIKFFSPFGYLMSEKCPRCHGDGKLTNLIEFCPEAPACACNDYPLGTWLKIKRLNKYDSMCNICSAKQEYACNPFADGCRYDSEIIVIVTDRMAKWLNSDSGKHKSVCIKCHSKFEWEAEGRKCQVHNCDQLLIKTRDLDTTWGTYGKMAPHSTGLFKSEVSVWKNGRWE